MRKRTATPEPVARKKTSAERASDIGHQGGLSTKRLLRKSAFTCHPIIIADARKMMTIEPTDKVWTHIVQGKPLIGGTDLQGAFVRIQPPAEATDEHIAFMREALKNFGVKELRILPRPKVAVVPASTHREALVHTSIRETVMAIAETTNTKDLTALKVLVESTLSKVGL